MSPYTRTSSSYLSTPAIRGSASAAPMPRTPWARQGIRILDISDVRHPVQIGFVETDCGSHTHTIVPEEGRRVSSTTSRIRSVSLHTATCSVVSHRKVSIIKVPLDDPSKAKVEAFLDVSPEIGCHDVTIFPDCEDGRRGLHRRDADLEHRGPAPARVILSRIFNPGISIHHGTGVTWDGKYLVIADEFAGSVTGQCAGDQASPARGDVVLRHRRSGAPCSRRLLQRAADEATPRRQKRSRTSHARRTTSTFFR